ncbi:hypothetical protein FACS189490_01140 [Clostridia bacterium]|nr:hypothetical protein FACS189490_01140 [Clostridia bacterium]
MELFVLGLKLMGLGIGGVFMVLVIFIVLIIVMKKLFPVRK